MGDLEFVMFDSFLFRVFFRRVIAKIKRYLGFEGKRENIILGC